MAKRKIELTGAQLVKIEGKLVPGSGIDPHIEIAAVLTKKVAAIFGADVFAPDGGIRRGFLKTELDYVGGDARVVIEVKQSGLFDGKPELQMLCRKLHKVILFRKEGKKGKPAVAVARFRLETPPDEDAHLGLISFAIRVARLKTLVDVTIDFEELEERPKEEKPKSAAAAKRDAEDAARNLKIFPAKKNAKPN